MRSSLLINGKVHVDDRGKLTYWNNFNMDNIRRMYTLFHGETTIVRAWQGHQIEQKWLYVLSGAFKVVLVKPDNWLMPSAQLPTEVFDLDAGENEVLHIPGGYASGIIALKRDSKIIVFSDLSVEESANDDYRFESTKWYNW